MKFNEFLSKITSRVVIGNVVAMLVVGIAIVLGTLWCLDKYTRHGEYAIVPNLRGKSYEQAQHILETKGLIMETGDSGYVKELPIDAILEQSVKPGAEVKPGRIIYVTVNSGTTPTLVLPDIADNSSYREAETKLKAIGFKLGDTEFIHGEKDWVYEVKVNGRNVSAGARIPVNARITLVVGNGTYDEDEIEVDSAALQYPIDNGLDVETDPEDHLQTP